MVEIDCSFFTGKTEALRMDDTLNDLVIGNINGSKLPDMSRPRATRGVEIGGCFALVAGG